MNTLLSNPSISKLITGFRKPTPAPVAVAKDYTVKDLTMALQDLKKSGVYKGRATALKKEVLIQKLKELNYDFSKIRKKNEPVAVPSKPTYAQVIIQQPKPPLTYAEVLQIPKKRGRPKKIIR